MNNDLISRQAAIDALADYIHNIDKAYSTGKLSADDCQDAAKSVLDELPSAQPEQRWIPCSERLPEEDMDVLVWIYGTVDVARVDRDCDTREWRWSFEEFNLYGDEMEQVVAWMPLPEPYKEKDNERA